MIWYKFHMSVCLCYEYHRTLSCTSVLVSLNQVFASLNLSPRPDYILWVAEA